MIGIVFRAKNVCRIGILRLVFVLALITVSAECLLAQSGTPSAGTPPVNTPSASTTTPPSNMKLLIGKVWVHKYRFVDGQYEVSPHFNQRMQFNENGTYFFSWNNTRGLALNRWRFEAGQTKIVIKSMYGDDSKYISCDIVQLTPEYMKLRWKEGSSVIEDVLFSIRTKMRSFR